MCHYERKSQQGSRSGKIIFTVEWDSVVTETMKPEKLYFCLYPSNNGAMIQMESGVDGINMTLPPDTYRLLVFHNNIEEVNFNYISSFDSAKIGMKSPEKEECRINKPIYSAVLEDIVLEPGENKAVTIKLESLVQELSLEIELSNPEAITTCEASLIGAPASLKLTSRASSDEEIIALPFSLKKRKNLFSGSRLLFDGKKQENEAGVAESQQLLVEVTMKNGKKVSSTLDLKQLIDDFNHQPVLIHLDATVQTSPSATLVFDDWSIRPL